MSYIFNARKAIQASAVLLKKEHGRRTNYMRLLKLLYIADRESIRDTGRPITGDRVYAMERGPVLGSVLNLIKSEHAAAEQWDASIRKEAYEVELTNDPGLGALTPYEVRKLHEISERYADLDEWDMVNVTHAFPEWKRNKPAAGSRKDIGIDDILDAVGRADDKEAICAEAEYSRHAARVFG